jgi:hypothetical protein
MAHELDFGTASSAKRGRNPLFPFVPVIRYTNRSGVKSRQVRAKAFATAEEATAYAERSIEAMKLRHAERIADPRNRSLREWYGTTSD